MRVTAFFVAVLLAALACDAATFRVRFDHDVRAEPASGRLVVYLIRDGASVRSVSPADGPFWSRAPSGWPTPLMLAGYDHSDIFGSDEMLVSPQEMLDHLRRWGHVKN